MTMRFEFEDPDALNFLEPGKHATEVMDAKWVGDDIVVKVRLAPERSDCLLWVTVDGSGVKVDKP